MNETLFFMLTPSSPFTRIIFQFGSADSFFGGVLAAMERYKSSPKANAPCEISTQYHVSFFSRNSGRASHNAITTVSGPLPKSRQ